MGAWLADRGSEYTVEPVIRIVCPVGSVEGVKDEVKRRIEQLAPGGGFVLAPSHNFGDDVPLENILAFFETAEKFGSYS